MKSSRHIKTIIGFVCVIFSATIIGCAAVNVPLKNYKPVFTGDYSVYEGKRVYLMNFDNQANDTGILEYYSPDQKFRYSKPWVVSFGDRPPLFNDDWIHNYFWYAFRDAFTKAGMVVSDDDNPDLTAQGMWVTLLSITDVKYDVQVTVQKKDKTVITKPYTIQEPPLAEKDRNPAALEQRAYRMTNRLIGTIMKDPGFQKVLTEP